MNIGSKKGKLSVAAAQSQVKESRAVGQEKKVAFLRSPDAYPEFSGRIEVKETHMSWVFLAGSTVYKLKKPIAYPFVDYRSINAREHNCREELRLNRRLAPETYLDVIPLAIEPDGQLVLGGQGCPVDWLVKMRRLPQESMLHQAIARGSVVRSGINQVATLLANFYRRAEPVKVSPQEYIDGFASQMSVNEGVMARFELERVELNARSVTKALRNFLEQKYGILADRVREGHIVEGHGDLRPQHICLSKTPVIIDCLEFKRAFRLVDPFDDLALLELECERLGAPWVGRTVAARCVTALEDSPSDCLLAFYTAFRSSLRARLSIAHLLDSVCRDSNKWIQMSRNYLTIARRAISRLDLRAGPPAKPPRDNA